VATYVVNEGSTAYLTVSPKDKAGAAAAPISATYEIVDVRTGTTVRTSTSISPGASMEITLAPEDNVMLSTATYDVRRVLLVANYGVSDVLRDQFTYRVRNLQETS